MMRIGSVTWKTAQGSTLALLYSDGSWLVVAPGGRIDLAHARALRALYGDDDRGPADGPYGVRILHDFAREVSGSVRIVPRPSAPPGTVY